MKWKRSKKTDSSGAKKGSTDPVQDSSHNENSGNSKSQSGRSQSNNHSASHQQAVSRGEREYFTSSSPSAGSKKVSLEPKGGMMSVSCASKVLSVAGDSSSSCAASSPPTGLAWTPVRHLAECGRSLPSATAAIHNPISDKQLQEDPFYRPYVS